MTRRRAGRSTCDDDSLGLVSGFWSRREGGWRDDAVGVLLRGLTEQMRQQGLIPVTIDRFR